MRSETKAKVYDTRKLAGELDVEIIDFILVIVREPKTFENLENAGLKLTPLFTMEELKEIAE